ncbi:hypothetical protein GQ55_9G259100 [Panicum hallii var. hallii]|uniref:Uncharacterized protein n=1 Tax=Panicum hallii var. hallii TaxID=1504633 RepID=A0A2T7C727_9POAL|nr:hypothetical protein GQ55_9G259100 [Panicum hallii var. hallii]
MFRGGGGGCHGGGRRGGFGDHGGMFENALPHRPRLQFYGAIGLPLGNRTCIPNVLINPIRWLKDVVKAVGGTTPIVQIEVVRQPHFKKVRISFQVPVQNIDFAVMAPGEAIPVVSIDAVGGVPPNWVTYERLAVEVCLQQF